MWYITRRRRAHTTLPCLLGGSSTAVSCRFEIVVNCFVLKFSRPSSGCQTRGISSGAGPPATPGAIGLGVVAGFRRLYKIYVRWWLSALFCRRNCAVFAWGFQGTLSTCPVDTRTRPTASVRSAFCKCYITTVVVAVVDNSCQQWFKPLSLYL